MIMRFAAYGILAVALMIASLTVIVLFRRNGLSYQWLWFALPAGLLLFVLLVTTLSSQIRRLATVTELPMYLLKRRKLFGLGYLLLLLANITYIVAYASGILPGLAILFQMLGLFGFLACVFTGYSRHPAQARDPFKE